MKIQTKPKEAGPQLEAVQFQGDSSVAPDWIFWCPPEVIAGVRLVPGHWRCGGESHGGRYDSGSSRLELGDWVYRSASGNICVLSPQEFERDWQTVPSGDPE